MKFKSLIESPINIGDIIKLKGRNLIKNELESKFKSLNLKKSQKLFSDYNYIIEDDIFYVFKDKELLLFIIFKKINNSFYIKNIENLSNIKGLAFNVYKTILAKNIAPEILTGDALSVFNIKSHKNALTNGVNIYIRKDDKDYKIETPEEIDKIMKQNSKTQFVIKESYLREKLIEMYNISLDEYLDYTKN